MFAKEIILAWRMFLWLSAMRQVFLQMRLIFFLYITGYLLLSEKMCTFLWIL
jgi:hypothetical protein